jgi:TPR repeat protein
MVRADYDSGEQARALFAQAAALLGQVLGQEPDNQDALCCLGDCCYRHGELGGPLQWFRKAADLGHARAQFNLAGCYAARKDMEQAAGWLRKAATQGSAAAQSVLGTCYARGDGVREDMWQAAQWWRKAAELGHAGAQSSLGECYSCGEGVARRDAAKAAEWWRKAADLGNADAQYNLGACFEHGQGVRKDMGQAMEWYRACARTWGRQSSTSAGRRPS